MTDSSEIGRYGTLRLLKRHEPETTVAFFPIDDDMVTVGRSKQCSVRLYYDCVSELHCTLQFSEEGKAFLLVQGTNGLLVDGCQVNPSRSPGSSPTTVPLTNGSEIEIYKKRFKFEYPPKEIRAALLATPRNTKPRRSLRMSMIRSAQVFTPRGSLDGMPQTPQRRDIGPSMDWEALRTPVRVSSQDGTPDQETTLLEGHREDAVIVEEEKDLIILEKIDNNPKEELVLPSQSKPNRSRSVAFSIPTGTPPPKPISIPQSARMLQRMPPAAPVNRRRSAPSLHRAVVLRSAQRAFQREQEQFEEKLEEDEVEAEVSPERELGPCEVDGTEDDDDVDRDEAYQDQEEHDGVSELYPPIVPSNSPPVRPARRISAFRASLDAMRKVIPLPFNWKAPEEVPLPDEYDEDDDDEHDEELEHNNEHEDHNDDDDDLEDKEEPIFQTPIRHNLGPFMTPQVHLNRPAQRVPIDVKPRASMGGNIAGEGATQKIFGGAQRVRVVPAWKIRDIVLPDSEKMAPMEPKKEVKKERISEEERQAIMARRKSALHTPSSLPAPGPRTSAFPPLMQSDAYTPGEDLDENADTMLEKMRQKMVDLRRKSEVRKMRMSTPSRPRDEEFSLLASSAERKNRNLLEIGIVEETLSQTKRSELGDKDITELPLKATGSSHVQDRDDLDLLEASNTEFSAALGPETTSLTPRFDGVREMFRQPRVEPRTPSFTGFTAMFKQRSDTTPKTPSFRGVRELFNRPGGIAGLATPRLDLGEIFDEDDSPNIVTDPEDERQITDQDNVAMSPPYQPSTSHPRSTLKIQPEEDSVALTSAPKTNSRARKAAASTSKRLSRKKDVPPVDVPSAVHEEPSGDQEDDDDGVEEAAFMPAPPVRRVVKRSARHPTPGDVPFSGESDSRSPRNTRKATGIKSESTTKGIVVHKTRKTRRVVEDDSEDERTTSSGKNRTAGRGKRKNHQASETGMVLEHYELEIPAKPKVGSRKVKETEPSDAGDVSSPKSRRTRIAKTPQGRVEPMETTSAPAVTKATRRKTEESSEVEYPVTRQSRRGARTKIAEPVDEPPIQADRSSEPEDITPPPTRGKVTKKGWIKKTSVPQDTVSDDDKENSGHQLSDKTPAVRTRRTAVTPAEAVDAPAKRTRSKT